MYCTRTRLVTNTRIVDESFSFNWRYQYIMYQCMMSFLCLALCSLVNLLAHTYMLKNSMLFQFAIGMCVTATSYIAGAVKGDCSRFAQISLSRNCKCHVTHVALACQSHWALREALSKLNERLTSIYLKTASNWNLYSIKDLANYKENNIVCRSARATRKLLFELFAFKDFLKYLNCFPTQKLV